MAIFTCTYLWWFVIQFLRAFHALTPWCDGPWQKTPMWSRFSFFGFRGIEVSWDLLRHFPHFLPGFYGASLWFNGKGRGMSGVSILHSLGILSMKPWYSYHDWNSWHLKNRSWKMCFLLRWLPDRVLRVNLPTSTICICTRRSCDSSQLPSWGSPQIQLRY